jgi:hypothetical protein
LVKLKGEEYEKCIKNSGWTCWCFVFLNGLQWIISPANVAESLGMPLLEGVGLSTQIGDLGSFFITVGAMTLIGAITTTRHWFYAPSMLLLVAALYRTLSTLLYGAPFVMSAIVVEVVVGLFLIFVSSKIAMED